MPWQPPIPAGAFWTEDALKIGAALSLLGYCYDKVGRDGQVRLNLREAAGDMGVPYPTVKRWWEALNKTVYITGYHERGRIGMDVQMSKDWLDWRYGNSPKTGSEMIPIHENGYVIGTKTGSNMIPNSTNRDENGTEMGSEMIPNTSAYKVLISTDQAESHGGSEDQDRTRRTHPPAIALVFEYFPHETFSAEQTDDICSTVTDIALWREVLTTWRTNGYKPRVGNLLNRYEKEAARSKAGKGHRNGNRPIRQDTGQNPERAQWSTELTDEL